MRINIGCGQTPTPGWRNFDNSLSLKLARIPSLPGLLLKIRFLEQTQYDFIQFARSNQIEYGDATRALPLADNSVEVLYSSHMLEHLDQTEVFLFLEESKRVLMSGGILRLAVPDIKKQVDQYLLTGDADQFIEGALMCIPRPRTIAQRLKTLAVGTRHHQWMYDGRSMCHLLSSHGFKNAKVVQPGETSIKNPGPLDLYERLQESVYVETENP